MDRVSAKSPLKNMIAGCWPGRLTQGDLEKELANRKAKTKIDWGSVRSRLRHMIAGCWPERQSQGDLNKRAGEPKGESQDRLAQQPCRSLMHSPLSPVQQQQKRSPAAIECIVRRRPCSSSKKKSSPAAAECIARCRPCSSSKPQPCSSLMHSPLSPMQQCLGYQNG